MDQHLASLVTLRFNGFDRYRFKKEASDSDFTPLPQMLHGMNAFSDRFSPVAAKRRQQAAS